MSRIDPGFGLLFFEELISQDTLAAKGSGAAESAYTEAGPIPGHPEPRTEGTRWRPQILQAQSVGLIVRTARGGYPGISGAAGLYRLSTQTSALDLRGWCEPNLVTGWTAPDDGWGGSSAWIAFAAAVVAETGVVIVTAVDGSRNALTWSWNPRTGTITTLYDWAAGALDGLTLPIGMAYDRDAGRLLLWSGFGSSGDNDQTAYYSTDGGTTWALYSRGFTDGFSSGAWTTTGQYQVAPGDDLDWCMVAVEKVNQAAVQLVLHRASSDRGVTWDIVTDAGLLSRPGQLLRGPAGFAYVHVGFSDNNLKVKLTANARVAFTTEVVIDDSQDFSACWACADDDGMLYAFARGTAADTKIAQILAYRSADGGLTWDQYGWAVLDGEDATHYFEPWQAVASCGQVHLIGTSVGSSSVNATVQILTLGGWCQVAHGAGVSGFARDGTQRFGWGPYVGARSHSNAFTGFFAPWSQPANQGWNVTDNTGTADLTTSDPSLELTTAPGQAQTYDRDATGTNATYMAVLVQLRARADSSTLADIGTGSAPGLFVRPSLEKNATYRYGPFIDIGSDGMQLRDGSTIRATLLDNATLSDGTHFDVNAYFEVRMNLTKGRATCWVRQPVTSTTETRWADNQVVTNDTGTQDDHLSWGAAVLAHGHFRQVAFTCGGDWQYGIDTLSEITLDPSDGVRGHQFGHPLPGYGAAYPVPDGTATTEDLALIRATGGPTFQGELVDLPAGHTYPIEALYPATSPRPLRGWKATGTTATRLVWDQGANKDAWWGGAVGLAVLRASPAQWVLQRSPDGITWTTLGTLDLTVGSGLKWIRVGRTVSPDTATATIASFIREGMYVGGHFDCDGKIRKIARISAGFWSSAAVQQVRIELEGVDGTEASSGTAGALVAPGGILVAYPSVDLPTRFLRLTVASGQATPDVYRAGIAGIGRIVGVGGQPGWGWSRATSFARSYSTASDGVPSARELGAPSSLLGYSWEDGALLGKMRLLSQVPDYVAASGGAPIGTVEDHGLSLAEWAEHKMRSGQIPTVVLPFLPGTTSTILDPSLFVYGRLAGEMAVTGMLGTEGQTEIVLSGPLSFQEIRG